jgi:hypothetical protein
VANWHVLTGSADGNSFTLVYHVPVPGTGTNRAGVQWRPALLNSGLGGKTVLPDGDGTGGTVSAAEKASIAAGALFEVVEALATNPGETAAALQARVDAYFAALTSRVQAELQARLAYFGYTH